MQIAVVALGGNAISPPGEKDTIQNQFHHTRQSLDAIINLLNQGILPVITHGNGPQVGNAALRAEITSDIAPYLPLGINVADTEGGMGYMIEQSLQNRLRQEGIDRKVVTIITQVRVDHDDPSVQNPTKYIGPVLKEAEAKSKAEKFQWAIREFAPGQWRRVVASPMPLEIINGSIIADLVSLGHIVIAAGGGGVPIYQQANGDLEGLDAVIDKDRASALLANQIQARRLYIMTAVPSVMLDFGQPTVRRIDRMTAAEARQWLEEGQFPPGNMGPKIEASLSFLEHGGEEVIITSLESIQTGKSSTTGTLIVP